jgi:hypothetical protein
MLCNLVCNQPSSGLGWDAGLGFGDPATWTDTQSHPAKWTPSQVQWRPINGAQHKLSTKKEERRPACDAAVSHGCLETLATLAQSSEDSGGCHWLLHRQHALAAASPGGCLRRCSCCCIASRPLAAASPPD